MPAAGRLARDGSQRPSIAGVIAVMPTSKKSHLPGSQAKPRDPLTEFLTNPENKHLSTAEYVAQGVGRVTDWHLRQLQPRLEEIRERIIKIKDSERLQYRLVALAHFFEETATGPEAHSDARREVAFALAYFFHGGDRIPDGTPRYGLLDDALVVEAVLERSEAALREHWHREGREWPEEF